MSEKPTNQHGASTAKLGAGDKFSAYFRNHQMVAVESLAKLLSTPASSLLTWLVIAIALTLPGALYMAVNNLQQLSGHFEASGQMTVFLTTDIREADSTALRLKVGSLDQVNKVVYVSPEQALEEFTQYGGISEALSFLDENPLPAVLLVEPV